jgi:hypothetical protein
MPEADVAEHAAIKARTSASVSTSGGNRLVGLSFRRVDCLVHRLDDWGKKSAMACHLLPKPGFGQLQGYLGLDHRIKHPGYVLNAKRSANALEGISDSRFNLDTARLMFAHHLRWSRCRHRMSKKTPRS